MVSEMKQEWQRFKHDPVGLRFELHRQRMTTRPHWHRIVRGAFGLLLLLAGIAMLFLPGPGLLGILFGLALLAGMSHWLAQKLDRAEPRVRDKAKQVRAKARRLRRSRRSTR